MKIEIKFRGRGIGLDKWVYGYYWRDNSTGQHKITMDLSDDNFCCHEIDVETLGEYVGINDKDNNQMYEGDIVKYTNSGESGLGRIEKWRGGFVVVWDEVKTATPSVLTPMFYLGCSAEWEIVGNIYELKSA